MAKTYLMIAGVFLPAYLVSLSIEAIVPEDNPNLKDIKMFGYVAGLIVGGMLSAKFLKEKL